MDADEDGEGAECEGLERYGGVPAHVVGGEVCFCRWEGIPSVLLFEPNRQASRRREAPAGCGLFRVRACPKGSPPSAASGPRNIPYK